MKATLLVILILACAAIMLATARPDPPGWANRPASARPSPDDEEPRIIRGRDAILAAIGDRLPEAAAAAGMAPDDLRHALNDKDFGWDDTHGKGIYMCEGLVVPEGAAAAGVGPAASAGTVANAVGSKDPNPDWFMDNALNFIDVFNLHSKKDADQIILLDFTGHETVNTYWNSKRRPKIVSPPYDTDGNTATFSTEERANIYAIWRAVAEDYAPYDVDVTTDESLAGEKDALLEGRGTRCVIGGSSYDWFKQGAGGVAYVGVFGDPFYQPAFVFPAQLGNGKPKYVWEATSHEVGHNLGLSHDGTQSTGYYEGHGDGAGGWAPIMGVGYYREVSQWSKGEYAGANNQQDDLAIMAGYIPYRADDHGNAPAAATELTGTVDVADATRMSVTPTGNIERTADQDWLLLPAGAGELTATLAVVAPFNGYNRGDADVKVELFAVSEGKLTLVKSVSQSSGLTIPTTEPHLQVTDVAEGWYYLAVTGVADGDGVNGWSDYGSLGQWQLTVSYAKPSDSIGTRPNAPDTQTPLPPAGTVSLATSSQVYQRTVGKSRNYRVDATLLVTDEAGAPLAGTAVTITHTWTMASGTSSTTSAPTALPLTTSSTGTVTLNSPWMSLSTGVTATLTVSNVEAPNRAFAATSERVFVYTW